MFYEMFTEKFLKGDNISKELDFMAQGWIPLSPTVLSAFEIDVDMTWHITSLINLKKVKALQGKRKQLPTFTVGSDGIASGAQSGAEILINLTGKSSFRGKYDFFSKLDRNGLRWMDPMSPEFRDYGANNKFSVPIKAAVVKYLEDENFGDDLDRFAIPGAIKDMTGKEKAKFIKFYLDTSKKLINKKTMGIIQDTINSAENDYSDWQNDEVLLHDFKINYVMAIEDESTTEAGIEYIREIVTGLGLVYDGEMERSEISLIDI